MKNNAMVLMLYGVIVAFNVNCTGLKAQNFLQSHSGQEEVIEPIQEPHGHEDQESEGNQLWPDEADDYFVKVTSDQSTYYAAPKGEVKGLVICFHGTGGAGKSWFSQFLDPEDESDSEDMGKFEASYWVLNALKAGLVVIAPTSIDRQSKQWEVSRNAVIPSDDVLNVQSRLEAIKVEFGLVSDIPQYTIGMSNGGGFAPYFAYWSNFDKAVVHSSPAGITAFDVYEIPTLWIRGLQDSVIDHNSVESNIMSIRNRLGETKVPVFSFQRKPLSRSEFLISDEMYGHLIDLLQQNGLLSPESLLQFPSVSTEFDKFALMTLKKQILEDILSNDPLLKAYTSYLQEKLLLLDGEHRFTSEFFSETIQFLVDPQISSLESGF